MIKTQIIISFFSNIPAYSHKIWMMMKSIIYVHNIYWMNDHLNLFLGNNFDFFWNYRNQLFYKFWNWFQSFYSIWNLQTAANWLKFPIRWKLNKHFIDHKGLSFCYLIKSRISSPKSLGKQSKCTIRNFKLKILQKS